ncbi:hypothetical protein [Micromonospora echinospora]|nr:hypothetical protein [Micromonospora echinospora]
MVFLHGVVGEMVPKNITLALDDVLTAIVGGACTVGVRMMSGASYEAPSP